MLLKLSSIVISGFALLWSVTASAAGVEAIQLQHVPIDASLGCDRVFFKSTQYFKGTIYVLPYVMLDVDDYGEPIFNINELNEKIDDKSHTLSVQLYFPYDETDIKARVNSDNVGAVQTCNFTAVKNFLNKGITDPEQKIKTISPMPLTYIEVSIPDMIASVSRAGTKNSESNDIIDYLGKPRIFRLSMTQFEHESVLSALQSNVGLQARVRFHFKARQNDGAVRISINRQQIALNFKLNAKGKYIAQADLDVALKTAMSKSGITIEMDGGSSKSELFDKITTQLIEKVVSQLDFSQPAANDKTTPAKCDAPEGQICVSVVADYLSQKLDQTLNFTNSTAPEMATAESTVDLNLMRIEDPKIHVIKVISGEADPVFSQAIYAGDVVKINPGYLSTIYRDYRKVESYLTIDELSKPDIRSYYQDYLSSRFFSIQDETRNNQTMAVGRYWGPSLIVDEHIWKKITLRPQIIQNPRRKITKKIFAELPINISFSNYGNDRTSISFQKLMGDHSHWSAELDEAGSIVIKAKKDLGLMKLRESFSIKKLSDKMRLEIESKGPLALPNEDLEINEFVRIPQPTESVVMETRSWSGKTLANPIVIRKNERAASILRVAYFYVSKSRDNSPEENSTPQPKPGEDLAPNEDPSKVFAPKTLIPKTENSATEPQIDPISPLLP